MVLPRVLDADTIPVILEKQMGIQLKGDAQLHMLAEMPLRAQDAVVHATIDAVAPAAGFTTPDIAKVHAELTKRKAAK